MDFSIKTTAPDSTKTACLLVAVFENNTLSPAATKLDKACKGTISAVMKAGDIDGKAGQTLMLQTPDADAKRILLVGFGAQSDCSERDYLKSIKAAYSCLLNQPGKEAVSALAEVKVEKRDHGWCTRQQVEIASRVFYRFEQCKSKNDAPAKLKKIFMLADGRSKANATAGLKQGVAISKGADLTRDLANLPGNICTPTYLAKQAQALGRSHKTIKTSVLDEKAMEKLGMGSLLSVSRGSREPAKLIVIEYKGGKTGDKPVVLVGKGLTFDAGGISLKPSASMDEMKYDMCGGASVIGTLKAVAELGLPINVVGVVPSSENLPDGAANKPGDIVTSMSGQTIEILNTDAEGRLILCDALTYSAKFKPDVVIDIATLTGACVIALGSHASGLLGNDQALVDDILGAGTDAGDRAWQLPLWPEYDEQLKSPFADMANIGGREAGTITAACFLSRYTKEYRWAHIDIAGTAWTSGSDKGATGRPVPLLMQYLINRAAKG